MNNIQINGQRRWGPPIDWDGPAPPHGTEIFIKNLPEEVFELELYEIFSAVGSVYEVRLPVNWSGYNKGYAFLRFTKVCETDLAIMRFDGFEIRKNRKIAVFRSIDNTRLFLSAVPTEKNAEELKEDLEHYVENVKKVYVYPTQENRFIFRGYAFVEFETHRDAAIAKRILTPDICYMMFDKKCIAAWANPLPFLEQTTVNKLNVLFMRNIPKEIKGFHLKKIIESLVGDEEIKRIKRMNDFAFLTFKDHESADRALNILKRIPYLIPEHETQVEWAIPKEMVADPSENIRDFMDSNDITECSVNIKPQSICDSVHKKLEPEDFVGFAVETEKLYRNLKGIFGNDSYVKNLIRSLKSTPHRNTSDLRETCQRNHLTRHVDNLKTRLQNTTQSRMITGSGKDNSDSIFHFEKPKSINEVDFPGKFFGNNWLKSASSLQETESIPIARNCSPDSGNGSEEHYLHSGLFDSPPRQMISPYSSLSPSECTNCSRSPNQTYCSDEGDSMQTCFIDDVGFDDFDISPCASAMNRAKFISGNDDFDQFQEHLSKMKRYSDAFGSISPNNKRDFIEKELRHYFLPHSP